MRTKKFICMVGILLLFTLLPTMAMAEDGIKDVETVENELAEDEILHLTLEQAIDLALANNKQVELNRLSIEKAKLKLDQDKYAAMKIDESFVTNYEMAMAKYILPMISQMGLTLTEAQVGLSENILKIQVEKNYYEFLKMKVNLDNAKNALTRAKEQHRIAKESHKAGVLAKSDVIGTEVLVASQEAKVASAQNNFDKAIMDLAQILGLKLDRKIVPTTDFTFEPTSIDLEAEVEKALQNDLGILGAQEGLKVAEATFEKAKGYYTPNVFMYREAEYNLEEAKVQLHKAHEEAELKVRKAYLDLQSAQKGYETLEKSLESAKENYRVAKLRFEAGVATRQEVEQAAGALNEQEASVMEMLYMYNLAAAQFKYGIFN